MVTGLVFPKNRVQERPWVSVFAVPPGKLGGSRNFLKKHSHESSASCLQGTKTALHSIALIIDGSTERNIDARFDISLQRDNSNYMSSALKISLIRIGNSRGIRLPAPLIKKFGFDGVILLEEEGDRLVLKPLKRGKAEKLPWSETAREMASAREDWSDWEPSEKDGLQEIPWESSDQRKSQL